MAYRPQEPSHGFRHFSASQARSLGQSEWTTHSGLQYGGEPTYDGKQEHEANPLLSRHSAYEPQGEGTQGSDGAAILGDVSTK